MDGGGVDFWLWIGVVFLEADAGEGFVEAEYGVEFAVDELDTVPALHDGLAAAVGDDAGAEDDVFAGVEVAKVDAGGGVAAELAEQFVLHPADGGMLFPEKLEAGPASLFGAAGDDVAVHGGTVGREDDEAVGIGE